MTEKIELYIDKNGRLTLPKKIRDHLELEDQDDVWIELSPEHKLTIGRVKVKREIVE
jgi:AbrB family looped-hinge helix DNA binding protein